MRTAGILTLTLFAACGNGGVRGDTAEERRVRETFEGWKTAIAEGRFDAMFDGMTTRMQTLWLWEMMKDPSNAKVLEERKGKLSEETRLHLDRWFGANSLREEENVDPLPVALFQEGWLKETVRGQYERVKKELAFEYANARALQSYVDSTGATLMVKNIRGKIDIYSFQMDASGWKVDGHRASLVRHQ